MHRGRERNRMTSEERDRGAEELFIDVHDVEIVNRDGSAFRNARS